MWGTIISAGVALMNSESAGDSAKAGAAGADRGAETMLQMYRETADRLQPWVSTGGDALKRLSVLTGLQRSATPAAGAPRPEDYMHAPEDSGYGTVNQIDYQNALARYNASPDGMKAAPDAGYGDLLKKFSMADFQEDPGYQFRLAEGEKALQRSATARGLTMSTPGLKDMMRFNQDLASNEYSVAYTRDSAEKQRTFDYLSYLSGSGQNAAAQVGAAGTAAGNTAASLQAQAGMLSGQSTSLVAGARNQAIQGGVANYMYNDRYQQQMDMFRSVIGSRGTAPPVYGTGGGVGGDGTW